MTGVFLVNYGGDIEFLLGIEEDEVYVGSENAPDRWMAGFKMKMF